MGIVEYLNNLMEYERPDKEGISTARSFNCMITELAPLEEAKLQNDEDPRTANEYEKKLDRITSNSLKISSKLFLDDRNLIKLISMPEHQKQEMVPLWGLTR